jgi:hypothetical protein
LAKFAAKECGTKGNWLELGLLLLHKNVMILVENNGTIFLNDNIQWLKDTSLIYLNEHFLSGQQFIEMRVGFKPNDTLPLLAIGQSHKQFHGSKSSDV